MDEKFLKLTNAVYKVLEYFPESDPLKNKAKEKALAIMESLNLMAGINGWASFQNEKAKKQIIEDIDILLGYLWIAKSQSWLSPVNYLIISNEYEKAKRKIGAYEISDKPADSKVEPVKVLEPRTEKPVEPVLKEITINTELSDRHKKIIEYLSNNEKAQVMDLQKVLPDITKRTIRRDLDDLQKKKRITRFGEFNQIFYKVN